MSSNPVKIALCFHGIHGGENTGKNFHVTDFDKGTNTSSSKVLESAFLHFSKNILPYNDVDVFFHTWDTHLENRMVELYKPKKYKTEKQIKFDIPDYVGTDPRGGGYDEQRGQAHYSRWYSLQKSNDLKNQYENENNFKYDFVMHSRLDLCWTEPLTYKFTQEYFYTGTPIGNNGKNEYPDRWFMASSDKMNELAKIYNNMNDFCNPNSPKYIPQYAGISSHFIVAKYLRDLNYNVKHLWTYPEMHKMYRDL